MASDVFYRKWRPQTLAEVAGQQHVTQTLRNALEIGRVGHAYLFCGPRGTGKTSTGRILAKAVNCLANGRGEPCNACEMCEAVNHGTALDVIEIDAASNRGVDDIRDLREKVKFAPNRARYKVYIIDEVHMLTDVASNALLKTLEEPPPHAIFILATTEPHKLLTTILSRCQRFDFRRLSHEAVVSKLSHICQQEGIGLEPQGLRLIARSVSGSLRDAENVLQQLAVYYGNQITVPQVEEMLGITSDFRVKELVEHIVDGDIASGLGVISSVVSDGMDLSQFNRALVEHLRNVLLARSGAEASLDLGEEEIAEVKELAAKVTTEHILKALRLFGQIDFRARDYSALPLELAFVEAVLPGERGSSAARGAASATSAVPTRRQSRSTGPEPAGEKAQPPAEYAAGPGAGSGLERVRAHWSDFVATLRGVGSSGNLDAYLRGVSEPVEVEDDTLVVAFKYAFHKEKIEDPKYRRMVEAKLSEKFGTPNKVRCVLRQKAGQRPMEGHLVKAALQMGGRVTSVVEEPKVTGGNR